MELDVRPEPSEGEHEALVAALSAEPEVPPAYSAPWRLAALHEAAEDDEP